jgi:chemosensory pili system protein ChpA (sensor histidine kinase/response regulator)
MVGLKEFGDAAWACEQLYNGRLGDQQPADEDFLTFSAQAIAYLHSWIRNIEGGNGDGAHSAAPVEAASLALRSTGLHGMPLLLPEGPPSRTDALPEPMLLPPDLPSSDDLDLVLPELVDGVPSLADAADAGAPGRPGLPLPLTIEVESYEDAVAELQPLEVSFDLDLNVADQHALAAARELDAVVAAQEQKAELPALDTLFEADVPVDLPDVVESPASAGNQLPNEFLIELPSDSMFAADAAADTAMAAANGETDPHRDRDRSSGRR